MVLKTGSSPVTAFISNKGGEILLSEREERKKAYFKQLKKDREPKVVKGIKGFLLIALIAFLILSFLVSLSNPMTWYFIALSLLFW